jgi:23S rRNA (pseudouridine1915-N3)-methyltransferase
MKIIVVGKTKEKFWQAAEQEYKKRLQSFVKCDFEILKSLKHEDKKRVITEEGEQILSKIKQDDFVVVLDKAGIQLASEQFAQKIKTWQNESKEVVFVIGGTYGLSSQVLERADLSLSFGQATFTHEMIRTILLEQIYRSFMILSNRQYHY